jgi:hypothetical protein
MLAEALAADDAADGGDVHGLTVGGGVDDVGEHVAAGLDTPDGAGTLVGELAVLDIGAVVAGVGAKEGVEAGAVLGVAGDAAVEGLAGLLDLLEAGGRRAGAAEALDEQADARAAGDEQGGGEGVGVGEHPVELPAELGVQAEVAGEFGGGAGVAAVVVAQGGADGVLQCGHDGPDLALEAVLVGGGLGLGGGAAGHRL